MERIKINVSKLHKQGRTPIVIEGWSNGPYCIIPPEGSTPRDLLNEQVGQFSNGYGDIYMLTPQQTEALKQRIEEVAQKDVGRSGTRRKRNLPLQIAG